MRITDFPGLILVALSAVGLLGCNVNFSALGLGSSGNSASMVVAPGSPSDLEVAEIAKFLGPDGKSKLLGSAKLPQLAASDRKTQALGGESAAGAKVEVLDSKGQPTGIGTTADADGLFSLEGVPTGETAIIKVTSVINGQSATMRKITRPSEPLQCVKVDAATTMVTDKILSGTPLFKGDPPLEGAPLVDLFKPERVDALEESIRKGLEIDAEGLKDIEKILVNPNGDTSTIFDQVVKEAPILADVYHEVFERPDSTIAIRVKVIGDNHNQQRKRAISGVLKMQLQGVKAGTKAIEFWFSVPRREQWAQANSANDFTVTLDTWKYPDGTYTMETVLVGASGKRKMLGKITIDIVNSVASFCGS